MEKFICTLFTLTLTTLLLGSTTTVAQPTVARAEISRAQNQEGGAMILSLAASSGIPDSNFGVRAFALVSGSGVAKVLFGTHYSPVTELTLSLGVGGHMRSGNLEMRYTASVSAKPAERVSVLAIVEFDHFGADSVWYNGLIKYRPIDWLELGVHARRFVGAGPTVSATFGDSGISAWLSYMPVDFEGENDPSQTLFGVSITRKNENREDD